MRGKVSLSKMETGRMGITPAYAGKSCKEHDNAVCTQDHPRLCGEKIFSLFSHAPHTGSPPPMRGKDEFANGGRSKSGITPAYAGKSIADFILSAGNWDHPRLCGEKIKVFVLEVDVVGSPPPMRGKASSTGRPGVTFRITPAYAGKSKIFVINEAGGWDHPRLCGEKSSSCMTAPLMSGSPPPMRGKDWVHLKHIAVLRITPAYAGKSVSNNPHFWGLGDHPRLCGEKFFSVASALTSAGSPPPMRGKASPLWHVSP